MSTSASAMMEGDLLLDLFQTEFRKMHTDLVDKEVRLFHHLFHHLFATRLAKLEQFLLRHCKINLIERLSIKDQFKLIPSLLFR